MKAIAKKKGGKMYKPTIVVAPDSFKGSATAEEIATYIESGIKRVDKQVKVHKIPIADGGEGTISSLVSALGGDVLDDTVHGPFGQLVKSRYGLVKNENIAIIEVAETSGITLVERDKLNPYRASSYGLGELILLLIKKGVKHLYVGLGGSATNDGGIGMLEGLGVKFYDEARRRLSGTVANLDKIVHIDDTNLQRDLENVQITALADVRNVLTGKDGATAVYGKQKGAKADDIRCLDKKLKTFQSRVKETRDSQYGEYPGSGAAGGIGAALKTFCHAEIVSGIDTILKLTQMKERILQSDLVITGEGCIDEQTLSGKAPCGVTQLAKALNKPVIAIGGTVQGQLHQLYQSDFDLIISAIKRPMSLEEAMSQVEESVTEAGENAYRSYLFSQKILNTNKEDKHDTDI